MARRQPLRAPTGGDYGDRKALLDQQRAAPLPDTRSRSQTTSTGALGAGSGRGPRSAPPQGQSGIFGPTERPDEPLTAGIDVGPGEGAEVDPLDPDPNYLLRAVLAAFPSSRVLADLLARSAR